MTPAQLFHLAEIVIPAIGFFLGRRNEQLMDQRATDRDRRAREWHATTVSEVFDSLASRFARSTAR